MHQPNMDLAHWLPIVQSWDWDHMRRFPGAGIPDDDERVWQFLGDMRDMIERPGHDIHSVVPLVWHKGEGVSIHWHPEYTLIFYVQLGDPPVPIVLENGVYTPQPGETLILSPNTAHQVPPSLSDAPRIAIAMRVQPQ